MARRRLVFFAVAGLALAAIGVAGWYWLQVRFPARETAIAGTPFTLHIQDGVGSGEEAFVRRGLLLEQRYLWRVLGEPVHGPVEVRIADGSPCHAFTEPAGTGATGVAQDGFLCVDTRTPSWRTIVRDDHVLATGISAHELVHVWQAEHGCLPDPDAHRYRWLVEGMATDLAWRAQIAAGTATRRDAARVARQATASVGDLRQYERRGGSDAEYALFQQAVADLVVRAGQPAALGRFCAMVGDGTDWRAAFRAAFGLPVERFYDDFQRQRAAGFATTGGAQSYG